MPTEQDHPSRLCITIAERLARLEERSTLSRDELRTANENLDRRLDEMNQLRKDYNERIGGLVTRSLYDNLQQEVSALSTKTSTLETSLKSNVKTYSIILAFGINVLGWLVQYLLLNFNK